MKFIFLTLFIVTYLFADSKLFCVGATTIQPIIEQISKKYKQESGIDISVQGGGSIFGIEMVTLSKADIGMVSRDLTEDEKKHLSYITIGYDSLAIIVNAQNKLKNISTKDLIDVYKENITNWKSLGGESEKIMLISKKVDRGTMAIFENHTKLFHPNNQKNRDSSKMVSSKAWEAGSNNDMIVWVGGVPNAIGFISYGHALSSIKSSMPIKILDLDEVRLNFENIKNKKYPIIRELNIVYKNDNIKAKNFATWLLGEYAQEAVEKNNFIKVRE